MAKLSLDNGRTYYTADQVSAAELGDTPVREALDLWDTLVARMHDTTRERVHALEDLDRGDPDAEDYRRFLVEYLRRAPHDLVV